MVDFNRTRKKLNGYNRMQIRSELRLDGVYNTIMSKMNNRLANTLNLNLDKGNILREMTEAEGKCALIPVLLENKKGGF